MEGWKTAYNNPAKGDKKIAPNETFDSRGDLPAYLRQLKEFIRLSSMLSSNNRILEVQIMSQMRRTYVENISIGLTNPMCTLKLT